MVISRNLKKGSDRFFEFCKLSLIWLFSKFDFHLVHFEKLLQFGQFLKLEKVTQIGIFPKFENITQIKKNLK
jgi:hypothetical protein